MDIQAAESFKEILDIFKELAESSKETDKLLKELAESSKKTDRQFKDTDAKLEKLFKETSESFKETDKQLKETDARLDKRFKETDRKIDSLTGKWGRFVEGFVAPAAEWLFKEWGIEIHAVHQRVRRREDGKGIEIDILAMNGEYAVLIEVKSTLGVDDVKEHLERLEQFREFFPQYGDRKVVGAVAGIVIDEGADKFAYKNGLFVIAQSGESVKVLNDIKFLPKML